MQPNTKTYTALIMAFSKAGRLESVLDVLQELVMVSQGLHESHPLKVHNTGLGQSAARLKSLHAAVVTASQCAHCFERSLSGCQGALDFTLI